ncbi:uncharacterized protein [Garra rufa]|uniref:uncharacterized protein n=1 Tax=Garra rufa TaxID=137080 RepID=UPI003CCED4FC
MEWRIIIPVVCLIGILQLPGNAAQNPENSTSTNNTSLNNTTGTNQTTTTNQIATAASTNSTNTSTSAANTTATAPANIAKLNVVFKMNQTFNNNFNDLTHPDTKKLTETIISEVSPFYRKRFKNFLRMTVKKLSPGSIVVDSEFEFDNTNNTSPNIKEAQSTLADAAKSGNLSIPVDATSINVTDIPTTNATVTTAASTNSTNTSTSAANTTVSTTAAPTTAPANIAKLNVVFKMNQIFNNNFKDLAHPDTKKLTETIISEVSPFYRKRFKNFLRMTVKKLSPGSIVVDSEFEFDNTNNTSPNITEAQSTLADAAKSGNLSIPVDATSINVTEIPTTNATVTTAASTNSPNTSTSAANTTVSTTAAPTTAPANIAKLNVVFRINQTFNETYSNLSHPDTKRLTETIINAISPFYMKRFKNFLRMLIKKLSPGSIVVDSEFEFDNTNNTSPNITEVQSTLADAAKSGNLSIPVDATSINVTEIPSTNATTVAANTSTTTSAATTSAGSAVAEYNITFKMNDNFNSELSNINSDTAKNLTTKISTEFGKAYKNFGSYIRTWVRKYKSGSTLFSPRSGSIDVDGVLEFNKTISTPPNATVLAKALVDYVKNNSALKIDTTSIRVTDSSGFTASKSPVLASMLTAFWMTLASLLLSAVMH